MLTNFDVIFIQAESCLRLFSHGRRSTGFYNIHKPNVGILPNNQNHIRVWCDMHGPNGGWILLFERRNFTIRTPRTWHSYEMGFGKPGFRYWLGNIYMHAITLAEKHALRLEIPYVDERNQWFFGEYDNFEVSSPSTGYIIQVGKYRGNMIDLISDVNHCAFSTWDRDNDKVVDEACARQREGAWWYGNTCNVYDLNTGRIPVLMKTKELLEGTVIQKVAIS